MATAHPSGVRECSVARTLDLIGEKWSLLVLRELMLGSHRFADIVTHTGAPRDILTTRLRTLEQHGLIERRPYHARPVRFEYHLTDLGATLRPVVTMLRQWGDDHLAGPDGPPVRFSHSCGADFDAELVCVHCGLPADGSSVQRRTGADA